MIANQQTQRILYQLRTRYTLKKIEEVCGMPNRSLQVGRNVPRKYTDKLTSLCLATFPDFPIAPVESNEGSNSYTFNPKYAYPDPPAPAKQSFTEEMITVARQRLSSIRNEEKELLVVIAQLEEGKKYLETANVNPRREFIATL